MFRYIARRIVAAFVAMIVLAGISISSASAATVNNPEGLFFDKSCRKVSFHLENPYPLKGNIPAPITFAVFDEKTSRVLAEGTVPAGGEDDAIDVLRTFRFKAYTGRHHLTAWVDGRFLAETFVRTDCGPRATINARCVTPVGWWTGEVAVDVLLDNRRVSQARTYMVTVIGKQLGYTKMHRVGAYSSRVIPQILIERAAYGGQVVSIIVSLVNGKELKAQAFYYSECMK